MIEKHPFGRTGYQSTRTIFGAAALSKVTEEEAEKTLDVLLEYGINHIDTAPSYGDAELRIGPWMPRHRDRFFLATKTLERTRQNAWEELHQSLERMRVDTIDLWQMHFLVDPEEWQVAFGHGGALEALIEARDQGLVRYLGVTGHEVNVAKMHLRSLERFDFDAVLLPYNYMMMHNPEYSADFERLVQLAQERNVAVQTIKSIVRRPWDEKDKRWSTWYEPLTKQEDIDRAVNWVLSRPELFLITASDTVLLPRILDAAARTGEPPHDEEMAATAERLAMRPMFL